jgi:hypothetical protein
VIAQYAKKIYGLEWEDYLRLRHKGYFCSAVPMLRSARYRSGGDLQKFWRIALSESFLFIARCFTRREDLFSKVVYRIMGAMVTKRRI